MKKKIAYAIPKAELHIHFDGTLEPEMVFSLAVKNNIFLPFASCEDLKKAYSFSEKDDFFDLFLCVTQVLITEQDFYDVTYAYLQRAAAQGVVYAEIIFDIQTYQMRGIAPDIVYRGICCALDAGKRDFGIQTYLLLCFIRQMSEESAFDALAWAVQYRDRIIGVDLAGAAEGHPPSKFARVYKEARRLGFSCVAHAGEEDGPWAVQEVMDILHVDRIDHGVRAWEDMDLIDQLIKKQVPLTVCPLSNVALGVYPTLDQHPIKHMLHKGLLVSLHSDDPSYFKAYIGDVYHACSTELACSSHELIQYARNSFISSFLPYVQKKKYIEQLDEFCIRNSIF